MKKGQATQSQKLMVLVLPRTELWNKLVSGLYNLLNFPPVNRAHLHNHSINLT